MSNTAQTDKAPNANKMESNTNALNNLSIKSDAHNGNNSMYRQMNNMNSAGAAINNSGTDASRMLEAALQHMDGIIAGTVSLSCS